MSGTRKFHFPLIKTKMTSYFCCPWGTGPRSVAKKTPNLDRLHVCLCSDHLIDVSMSAVVCGGNVWVRGVICVWGFRGMITNKYMHIICKKRYRREGFIAQFHEQTEADFVLRLLSAFFKDFLFFMASDLHNCFFTSLNIRGSMWEQVCCHLCRLC